MLQTSFFLVVLAVCGLVGGFVLNFWSAGRSIFLVHWLGTSLGALLPLLLFNCLFLFPVAIDPVYFIVQELLIAGIAGGVLGVPVMVYHNIQARVENGRTSREVVFLLAIAGLFLFCLMEFRMSYRPAQLPI